MSTDGKALRLFSSALETGKPDPRQAQFLATAQTMSSEGFETISMRGFRASNVDLAWLQDEIDDYVTTIPGVKAERLVELIGKELPRVVQRLKGWSVDTDDWPETLRVSFETKDDRGWYKYSFSMSLALADDD